MRVTNRRRQVLAEFIEYVHLATSDLYALLSANDEASQRALRRVLYDLVALRLLKRERLIDDTNAPLPNWQYLYWLAPRGLDLARQLDLDPDAIGKAAEEKSALMLPHEHAITEFHLALNRAAGSGVWWRQRDLKHAFAGDGKVRVVHPDALFYHAGYYFFLEIERSKLGHYRQGEAGLMAKLDSYAEYFATRAFKERWSTMEGFFVLVVTRTARRASALARAVRESRACPLFRIAAEEACTADVLGPVWSVPTPAGVDGGPRALCA